MLVRHGVPFRQAHGILAGLVRAALDAGKSLSELTPAELAAHSPALGEHSEEYRALLTQSSWLESKVSEGGTASVRVQEQLDARARRAHPSARGRVQRALGLTCRERPPWLASPCVRRAGRRRARCPSSSTGGRWWRSRGR